MASTKTVQVSIDGNLYPFLKIPKFFMQNIPGYVYGEKNILVVTADHIMANGKEPLTYANNLTAWDLTQTFLKSVVADYSSTHPCNENLFAAIYDKNELTFFGRPLVCKWDKKIQLIFGSEAKDTGKSFNVVPLKFEGTKTTLNGLDVNPAYIEIPDMQAPDPQSAPKIKIPILIFKSGKVIFNLAVRLNDGVDYWDYAEAFKIEDPKERENALLKIFDNLYSPACSFSYMFSDLFQSRTFPREGLILKIVGAKRIESTDKKTGKTFVSVAFKLDTSDLPSIMVRSTGEDESGKKNSVLEPLNTIGTLFCNSNMDVAKTFIGSSLPNPSQDEPWLLHITGQGKEHNTVPKHTVYDSSFIPAFINQVLEASNTPQYYLTGSMEKLKMLQEEESLDYSDNPL